MTKLCRFLTTIKDGEEIIFEEGKEYEVIFENDEVYEFGKVGIEKSLKGKLYKVISIEE